MDKNKFSYRIRGGIWSKYYSISQIQFNSIDEYYIIMGNGCFNYYSARYLNRVKGNYKIHYILVFIDPLSGIYVKSQKNSIFKLDADLVYTFDYNDAKKMGAIHTMCLFSRPAGISVCDIERQGVYFIGGEKGSRCKILHEIYEMLKSKRIPLKFRIVNVPLDQAVKKDIVYNQSISYENVLNEIQEWNCILEILQPGQVGVTLRYYEAVVFNKKLLTNNDFVKQLPFYDPKYIQVFHDVQDIDIDWITNNESVDYKYKDEFSPVNLIRDIQRRVL